MIHQQGKQSRERGFTIVELLIVIVVIGILAAITIVAYSGITSRANNTKVQATAANVQKVLEAYNADNGNYPTTISQLTGYSGSTKLPTGITMFRGPAGALTSGAFTTTQLGQVKSIADTTGFTPLSSSNGLTTIAYSAVTGGTGGVLIYFDFVTGAVSTTYLYIGSANASSTFIQPAA